MCVCALDLVKVYTYLLLSGSYEYKFIQQCGLLQQRRILEFEKYVPYIKKNLVRTQKIHHKWFSKADTFWAHIDHIIYFLHPIIDPHFDIVFQPMAWASAASRKTFWWSVDRLEGVGKNKVTNVYPKCVCLGKSLMVNFLSSSEKNKLHI